MKATGRVLNSMGEKFSRTPTRLSHPLLSYEEKVL
jgi:hypothetical protein